jgi:hypothetical protein
VTGLLPLLVGLPGLPDYLPSLLADLPRLLDDLLPASGAYAKRPAGWLAFPKLLGFDLEGLLESGSCSMLRSASQPASVRITSRKKAEKGRALVAFRPDGKSAQ